MCMAGHRVMCHQQQQWMVHTEILPYSSTCTTSRSMWKQSQLHQFLFMESLRMLSGRHFYIRVKHIYVQAVSKGTPSRFDSLPPCQPWQRFPTFLSLAVLPNPHLQQQPQPQTAISRESRYQTAFYNPFVANHMCTTWKEPFQK